MTMLLGSPKLMKGEFVGFNSGASWRRLGRGLRKTHQEK